MPRNKSDFNFGTRPALEDVNRAYITGKITKDEANDLGYGSWPGSNPSLKDETLAHRRAGLSKETN
jgi:hypothetical protein